MGKLTGEKAKQREEDLAKGGGDGGNYFKGREGVNRLRIFPPPGDHNDVSADGFYHEKRDEDGNFLGDVPCERWLKGKGAKCEDCEKGFKYRDQAKKLEKEGGSAKEVKNLERKASKYGRRRKAFFVVADCKAPDKGPQIWKVSAGKKGMAKKVYALFRDGKGEFLDISSPKHGYDIAFTKSVGEKPIDTTYDGFQRIEKQTRLMNMDWLKKYPDVRDLARGGDGYHWGANKEDKDVAKKGKKSESASGSGSASASGSGSASKSGSASASASASKSASASASASKSASASASKSASKSASASASKSASASASKSGSASASASKSASASASKSASTSASASKSEPEEKKGKGKKDKAEKTGRGTGNVPGDETPPPCYEKEWDKKDKICQECPWEKPCSKVVTAKKKDGGKDKAKEKSASASASTSASASASKSASASASASEPEEKKGKGKKDKKKDKKKGKK